jgi:folate-binding protein YgfZ
MSRLSIYSDLLKDLGYLSENIPTNGPVSVFSSVEEEIGAIRTGAVIRDVSSHTHLTVRGNDALDFLHRISTNAVKDMQINQSIRTTFTNEKGRILDSVLLLRMQDTVHLIGHEGTEELLEYWLNKFIIADDVKVESAFKAQFVFEALGPQAEALMLLLFGEAAKNAEQNRVYTALCESHVIHFTQQKFINGKKKYLIFGPVAAGREVLRQCKYTSSIIDVKMLGTQAWELFRIEAGIPGPNELNDKFNPLEANLAEEINFKKGCYIGQEVIARLDTYGKTQKALCGFLFEGKISPAGSLNVFGGSGEEAGEVTSISDSTSRKTTIGLGYLRKQFLHEDAELFVRDGESEIPVFLRNFSAT